ncbi:MAG: ABC transporter permease, partial [candidate division Zixibacteria bacterium]|nr:ABC transporter permease [candidate division Zixibacteria bacterium]
MTLMIYCKLAWRNVLRNKRRTLIAGITIGIGLAALIYVDALILGMEDNMVKSATSSFLGEGQIHREGFRQTFGVDLTVNNLAEVVESIKQEEVVESFTMRTFCFGMISSPANVSSVSMVGVDPANERHLSQVDEALVEGTYFEGDDDRQLLIGRKLAELLEVGLGDRVVMTAAQAGTGDLAQEMFRVSGIYYFNVPQMDQYMAFVLISKARQMLALGDEVHQIALKFHDAYLGRDQDHPFWNRYSRNGNEAVGWTVLLPQLEAAFELSGFSTLIVAIILFGVVSLGIVNTLFMSLHERMFEFGVMRAVGTRPVAMGQLVILEAGA